MANRLSRESSPYLLQHAEDPVDWRPWGEDAFAEARRANKPIFLSIGYSTCHWCHLMARESFSDEEIGRLLNESFVSVKVDREERPDLDGYYLSVCQAITGSGGWPLTILLTPEQKPFYAATYLPKHSRFGMTGLLEFLPKIQSLWKSNPDMFRSDAEKILSFLAEKPAREIELRLPDQGTLRLAFQQLTRSFDKEFAGFGPAPKFLNPGHLAFLLRYWRRCNQRDALDMVKKTLQAMRCRGIFDQIGFGFHRYAADAGWNTPHFEKMLCDQALMASVYTEAFTATGEPFYQRTAREILSYALREMSSPEGAFYSAQDADTGGKEGEFYLWTETELRDLLGEGDARLVLQALSIEPEGNFPEGAGERKAGRNLPRLRRPLPELAREMNVEEEHLRNVIESAREKMFTARARRVNPARDDKILADWNGLMVAALAKAAFAFDQPHYAQAGRRAADFVIARMTGDGALLYHRWRAGDKAIPGFLDDYAFFGHGLIELYESTFQVKYLKKALELTRFMIKEFWDESGGGFYFSGAESEESIPRGKRVADGALPSGNSIALFNLLRLGQITGDRGFEDYARKTLSAFASEVSSYPAGHTQFLCGVDFALGPTYQVVIAGDSSAAQTRSMIQALRGQFIPNKVTVFVPAEDKAPEITGLIEYLRALAESARQPTAFICKDYSCQPPATDAEQMIRALAPPGEGLDI